MPTLPPETKTKTKTKIAVKIALITAGIGLAAIAVIGQRSAKFNPPSLSRPSERPAAASLTVAASLTKTDDFNKIYQLTKELESVNKTVSSRLSAPAEISNLSKLVKERALLVKDLMKKDPRLFLSIAIPKARRSSFPVDIRKDIEEEISIVANVETLAVDDFKDIKNSRLEYFLRIGNEKLNFYPARELYAVSDTRAQIKGFRLENSVVADTINKDNFRALAAPPLSESSQAMGNQKSLVFLVEFLDSGQRPFTKEQAYDLVFRGQFQNFMKEQSYNQVSFSGDVSDWITLQRKPRGSSVCGEANLDDPEIKNFINDKRIDLGDYDRLVFLVHYPVFGDGCSSVGKGTMVFNGNNYYFSESWIGLSSFNVSIGRHPLFFSWTWLDYVLAHELGHALGLLHAKALNCGDQTLYGNACRYIEYGNYFDTMGNGNNSLHFNGAYKESLGWVPASRSLLINQSGTYTINPLELSSGFNLAKVQVLDSLVVPFSLEYRKGIGFDAGLNNSAMVSNQAGLFVNYFKPNPGYFPITYLLDIDSSSTVGFDNPVLRAGNTFYDAGRGITIGPIKNVASSSITFDVKIEAPSCVRQEPRLADHNYTQEVSAGSAGFSHFLILNSDYFGCGQSDFNIVPLFPASWEYKINPNEDISLDPDEDSWKTVVFWVPRDAIPGYYLLRYEIVNKTSGSKKVLEQSIKVAPFLFIDGVVPLSGPAGTEITLTGSGFWAKNSIEFFNADIGRTEFFADSGDGKTIKFQVPTNLTPYKNDVASTTSPGEYKIKVFNGSAYSNIVSFAVTVPLQPGDVNKNGKIDIGDALFVAQYSVGKRQFDSSQQLAADVNLDGKITKDDANIIAQYDVRIIKKLPCVYLTGDVNCDGNIDCQDLFDLNKMFKGLMTPSVVSDVNGDGQRATLGDIQKLVDIFGAKGITNCKAAN